METNLIDEKLIIHWFFTLEEKLDIIAYKLGVNQSDIHKYFMIRLEEGNYTKEAKEDLEERLNGFLKTLTRVKNYKDK